MKKILTIAIIALLTVMLFTSCAKEKSLVGTTYSVTGLPYPNFFTISFNTESTGYISANIPSESLNEYTSMGYTYYHPSIQIRIPSSGEVMAGTVSSDREYMTLNIGSATVTFFKQ
jgi:hypothetical protein